MSSNFVCVVCDIDGTIAHPAIDSDGNVRGWYDYDAVHTDIFDTLVFSLVRGAQRDFGAHIVFLTARVADSFDVTLQWLKSHLVRYDLVYGRDSSLYHRESGDDSCDSEYKVNAMNNIVKPKHGHVLIAFDDSPLVVDGLHDAGYKVISVADQRNKF